VSGPAHRSFLSDWYSGDFPGSPARGLVFQYNPVNGDRRISGTSATLAGLEAAGDDESARSSAIARILLAHELVMGWGGIPVIWSGDELGMPDDPAWAAEPGHESDNRWSHRPRIDWSLASARSDRSSVPGRVFGELARVARIRAALPQLHASVEAEILPLHGPGVLPVIRRHPVGDHVGLYNVTGDWRPYPAAGIVRDGAREVLSEVALVPDEQGLLWIPPLSAWWIV
jgi:amylosucrase